MRGERRRPVPFVILFFAGLIFLTAALDSYRLYQAYEYAQRTGDRHTFKTEVASIAGGRLGASPVTFSAGIIV